MEISTVIPPPQPPAPSVPAPAFTIQPVCWVCGMTGGVTILDGVLFDLHMWAEQDPELAAYTGATVALRRCRKCSFVMPTALPALPNYFDRMYDTRWSDEWIEAEYRATYRDAIFAGVLSDLRRRCRPDARRMLDVGAHVGRLVTTAGAAGWDAEGIELNPKTAAFAAAATGRPIHQLNAHQLAGAGRRYDAVTMLDVLEHIPDPLPVLRGLYGLLDPGGWIAVKVPCGSGQLRKERGRRLLRPGYRINVANNLVHVNHFTVRSLRLALERAGFADVVVGSARPEVPPLSGRLALCQRLSRGFRAAVYGLSRLPGGVHTPLTLNLQAFARRP